MHTPYKRTRRPSRVQSVLLNPYSEKRRPATAWGINIEQLEQRRLLTFVPVLTPVQLKIPASLMASPDYERFSVGHFSGGSTTPYGITPAQMEGAYGVNSILFGTVKGDGSGTTVAIVDAYDYSTALNDLNAFSTQFGLPIFNSGPGSPTFTKYNQNGSTSSLPGNDPAGAGNDDWEIEESLDIEWVHAIAPKANIDLVEANSSSYSNLFTADQNAANLSGVSVVSDSWGGSEFSTETSSDSIFNHTGVTFLFSSGDSGAYEDGTTTIAANYPASSPNVVAVGGTTLSVGSGNTYGSESAWGNGTSSGTKGGGGGGISAYESIPSYQKGKINGLSTTKRTEPDVSIDANPASGVPIYDSYDFGASTPWLYGYEGGTSLACPMWSALIVIANQGRTIAGASALTGATQTLPDLYSLPSSDFHDITSGNNGYAAGTGYDLATGIGSPIANLIVTALAPADVTTNPVSQTLNVGQDAKFTVAATGASSVQWKVEPSGSSTFSSISGATSTTLDLSSATLAENGNKYEAVFSDSLGSNSTTTAATLTVYPAWLSTTSIANWNATSHMLTVTGAATIISDPGTDEPIITGTSSAAQVRIAPTVSDQDIHIGGVTLSGGAVIDMVSVGSSRSHTNHNVLVLGTLGNSVAPTFSIDSSSELNLEDNDLVVHSAASDDPNGTGTSGELSTIQKLAATGRNVAPGGVYNGTWTGNGLTSSAAATADSGTYAGDEQNVLAVGLNSDLFVENYLNSSGTVIGSGYNKWTVGSASENLAMNDIIVKYTYNGDLNLDGKVDSNASLIFSSFYDDGASTQNDYVFGDLNGDGKVDNTDSLIFSTFFGNGDPTFNGGDGVGNGLSEL